MAPEQFKQNRIKLKLTQSQMAERLGIKSGRTIRAWEAGERAIPEYIIKSLAKDAPESKDTK